MQNLLTGLFLTQREKEKTKKAQWFGK